MVYSFNSWNCSIALSLKLLIMNIDYSFGFVIIRLNLGEMYNDIKHYINFAIMTFWLVNLFR